MKNRSNTNTWLDSDGNRWTSAQVDRKTREACKKSFEVQRDKYGFNFCIDCTHSNKPLDPSHTISVKQAKEENRVELCWSIPNIPIRCRDCHNIHDKLYLGNGRTESTD